MMMSYQSYQKQLKAKDKELQDMQENMKQVMMQMSINTGSVSPDKIEAVKKEVTIQL